MRFGLGPVFACERSIASRRWQTYAARSFLLSALLAGMATVAWSEPYPTFNLGASDYAKLGESYFYAMIGVELALVLLAAPAATAGAICLDRSGGTLAHVLVTDLSDAEIILGKLAARLAPTLVLVAGTWPVMAISSLLGGIDPIALTFALAIIISVAMLGGSLALLLSVWARRTHEVLLAVYFVWALVLLAWPIWYALTAGGVLPGPDRWLLVANPFYLAFAPYAAPNQIGLEDYLSFFAVTLAASAVSILVAIWRMRPVACRSDGKAVRRARFGLLGRLSRALPGPSLDGNPVLWREWHRLRPSAWMTGIVLFVWVASTVTCCFGGYWIWRNGISPGAGPVAALLSGVFAYLILTFFGLLMLSAVAPTSMSEERQRGSLDVLVATPLSTAAILLGKWWGIFRLVPFLVIGPGFLALAMATARLSNRTPRRIGFMPFVSHFSLGVRLAAAVLVVATILTYGAALTSLGLALAIWIKRQSRAIATSVSMFVLVAGGWPILMMAGPGFRAFGLATLSPIYSAAVLSEDLTSRSGHLHPALWWIGLWNAAAAATAIGLCWLAARTFDEAFGRVPERPRSSHWLADVVVVVAGVTAAACLVGAIAIWVQGVHPHRFSQNGDETALFAVILIELLALILLSALAAVGAPNVGHRTSDSPASGAGVAPAFRVPAGGTPAPQLCARSAAAIALGRWWRVFRLALLLAIAPGLTTLSLATARDFWPEITVEDTMFGPKSTKGVMVTYTTPTGETSRRFLTGDRNDPTVQTALKELKMQGPVAPFGDRLRDAGLLILTFLAHAAAATSAGLAPAIWIKRRRPRLAVAICAPLFVTVGWLISVYWIVRNHDIAERLYALSPVWVADHLMEPLIARQPHSTGLLGWIAGWDAGVMLCALGVLCLVIQMEKRRTASLEGRMAKDRDRKGEPARSLVEV